MLEQLINIPTQSLVVKSREDSQRKVMINEFEIGVIQLNGFAIAQFFEGFELFVKDAQAVHPSQVLLSLKLSKIIADTIQTGVGEVEVSREELQWMRKWLEKRMQHCEKERDARSERFNPDTYIGQKLLLLDLRELLLGEVVY